jgi:excisionase family DNA binding protein
MCSAGVIFYYMKAIEQAAFAGEVMDYRGLSAYLKMAPNTLRHKVMRNEIPFYKIGSSVRFCKKDIDEWLAEYKRFKKRVAADVGVEKAAPPSDGDAASVGGVTSTGGVND